MYNLKTPVEHRKNICTITIHKKTQATMFRVSFSPQTLVYFKNSRFYWEKPSVCTGTRGVSETSLNTVVHENVKVYEPVWEIFFEISLNFFQELPSVYIFINCTNFSKLAKFIKIIFNAYLNFIKLSIISKIFRKPGTKF